MKILFISNYYPPHEVGGYEQLCRDVVERMAQRGHETHVLTSNRGMKSGAAPGETYPVYRVLAIQPDYEHWLNPTWQFFLTRPQVARSNQRHLYHIVQQVRPDLIFFWNLQGLTRKLVVSAESMPGVAVAYWLQVTPHPNLRNSGGIGRLYPKSAPILDQSRWGFAI